MSTVYPSSRVTHEGATFWLEQGPGGDRLVITDADASVLDRFDGASDAGRFHAPASPANAAALRDTLPWLRPRRWGLETSAGTGDRLGLCTPGHVLAFDGVTGVHPVFAQQSTREMGRTHRTPRMVLDDATWGAFQGGWTHGVGADADHLKDEEAITACAEAGFVFFTIDPGDEIDIEAHDGDEALVRERAEAVAWDRLDLSLVDALSRYAGTVVPLESGPLVLDEESVVRAFAKSGPALVRGIELLEHLESLGVEHEVEFAIDETDRPTTPVEHVIIIEELARLGFTPISFAPRWVGQFEKGVEYLGDRAQLAADFARHAEIARALGPYKLSLHSGSDKFSIYPAFHEATGGICHLKTAGTSWIESLRVVAAHDPSLMRQILALSLESFEENRHSYHLSCDPARIDVDVPDDQLNEWVTLTDSRQVMHVGYGPVLEAFGPGIKGILRSHAGELDEIMRLHFKRHLDPFASAQG